MAVEGFDEIQVRVARRAGDFDAVVAFYGATLGLPVIASFDDHDGHDGVIFGLPDASRQLEILRKDETVTSPTGEDQLVFYLGSAERVEKVAARMRGAGHEPWVSPNPYWERTGAVCFVDPDGSGSSFPPKPGSRARVRASAGSQRASTCPNRRPRSARTGIDVAATGGVRLLVWRLHSSSRKARFACVTCQHTSP